MPELNNNMRVELGERSYDIVVDSQLMSKAYLWIEPVVSSKRIVIVSDENVAPLYLESLQACLSQAAMKSEAIVLPPGEGSKSLDVYGNLVETILAYGIERGTCLIALGGGVIGDLTGFAASSLLRGIDFIQIPTTLLSQVDSSVGGKTGINAKAGKNLIGAFHQPRLVLIDTQSLSTLPKRELLAGYAEVVKYGLINNRDFFDWLKDQGAALIDGDEDLRQQAILTSCQAKADVVACDEREGGVRALLNLGHTFGHAIEKECGYGTVLHGEAVAIGMVMAFEFSAFAGFCPERDAQDLRTHLQSVGLPVDFRDLPCQTWTAQLLMGHMMKDKKVKDGKVTFVLARAIGEAFLSRDVEDRDLEAFLTEFLDRSLKARQGGAA